MADPHGAWLFIGSMLGFVFAVLAFACAVFSWLERRGVQLAVFALSGFGAIAIIVVCLSKLQV